MHHIGMRVGAARPLLLLGLIVIVTVALPGARSVPSGASGQQAPAAAEAKDGDWTMPGKNFAATRYSGLTQITVANAAGLKPVWNFSTGVLRGHEGQPLVVGDTLYVVTPYPNVLYAFDLTQEGYSLRNAQRRVAPYFSHPAICCQISPP